jgi:nitrite reductase/ring-hydroxylating ferredoxin subunit
MPTRIHRSTFMRRLGLGAGLVTLVGAGAPLEKLFSAGRALADTAAGLLVGNINNLDPDGALHYTDPASGDPAVAVGLSNNQWVAYDAVCTHAGCTVAYDPNQLILICPCHGSEFDPAQDAAVIAGPAPSPLSALPIRVDAGGNVYALDDPPTDTPTPTPIPRKKTLKCKKGYKKGKKHGKQICLKIRAKKQP